MEVTFNCPVIENGGTEYSAFYIHLYASTVMSGIFKDKNNQEALFTKPGGVGSDLEYTIVRPGGLGTGPPTGKGEVKQES